MAEIKRRVQAGTLHGQADIGLRRWGVEPLQVKKHFQVNITDDTLTYERKHEQIAQEAELDGIYVIRSGRIDPAQLAAAGIVRAYKQLKEAEKGSLAANRAPDNEIADRRRRATGLSSSATRRPDVLSASGMHVRPSLVEFPGMIPSGRAASGRVCSAYGSRSAPRRRRRRRRRSSGWQIHGPGHQVGVHQRGRGPGNTLSRFPTLRWTTLTPRSSG